MISNDTVIQIIGGIMCLVGVVGLFSHISQDDGAIAISGAIDCVCVRDLGRCSS
jgi:hypothetical protein